MIKDYYKILNVSPQSDYNAIKKSYKQAVLFWHPDKNKSKNAHEMFLEINEAYNILCDTDKRAVYDALFEELHKPEEKISRDESFSLKHQKLQDWIKEARQNKIFVSADNALINFFDFINIHIGKWFWEILFVYLCLVGHQTRFFYCLVHVWCPTKRT